MNKKQSGIRYTHNAKVTVLATFVLSILTIPSFSQVWNTSGGTNIYYSAGDVGIGLTNPESKLHIFAGESGGDAHNLANLTIEHSDHAMISLLTPNNKIGYYGFADSDDNFVGGLHYDHSTDYMYLRVNNRSTSDASLVLRANGNVGIGIEDASAKLEVNGTTKLGTSTHYLQSDYSTDNDYTILRFSATNAGDDNYLISYGSGHSNTPYQLAIKSNQGNNSSIGFYTDGDERIRVNDVGNVGIGTIDPDNKLTVAGTVKSREVIVEEDAGADFVFEEAYDLPTLEQVEEFVKSNKHLPGIAPASEMMEEGVKVGELQIQLLQKIEELTLYTIEQDKKIQNQQAQIDILIEAIKSTGACKE